MSFSKKVDTRSRCKMQEFLIEHFRYDTANSWNRSTSYACNMKIWNLDLPEETREKLYDFLYCQEIYDEINGLLYDFGEAHNFEWQAGFNGRSGGFLVLYQGKKEPSGFKSFCTKCGQKNFTSVAETNDICGRCHQYTRIDFKFVHMNVVSYPGRSVDMDEDFEEWDMYSLRQRAKLVQEFDQLADNIVETAKFFAENYSVGEETYYVERTRKVLVAGA